MLTVFNGKEATVNRALDSSTYLGKKLVHSVFGKINYGGLKHNRLYLGLVVPSGACVIKLITAVIYLDLTVKP